MSKFTETIDDKLARLQSMAQSESEWDLSDNDRAAILWIVEIYKRTHDAFLLQTGVKAGDDGIWIGGAGLGGH